MVYPKSWNKQKRVLESNKVTASNKRFCVETLIIKAEGGWPMEFKDKLRNLRKNKKSQNINKNKQKR